MLRERIHLIWSRSKPALTGGAFSKHRPALIGVGAVVGFIAVVALQLQPPDPESRLPDQYRLAALIQRQQQENEDQRTQVETARQELESLRTAALSQRGDLSEQTQALSDAGTVAGLTPVRGTGITVSLTDSTLDSSPTGNVNDLVIHSQDVQAVVNGLWGAGAEAMAINGQRLVSTTAVLCVGNTLLINGTVHSPPYEVSAIGADRNRFSNDPLVRQVRDDAQRFSLGFSIGRERELDLPGYTGPTALKYAQKKS